MTGAAASAPSDVELIDLRRVFTPRNDAILAS
jgi:hypothetical protein